jgi:hypothetical protein
MERVERGYWGIIKRFAPGVPSLVGEESFALLEVPGGCMDDRGGRRQAGSAARMPGFVGPGLQ